MSCDNIHVQPQLRLYIEFKSIMKVLGVIEMNKHFKNAF